MPQKKIQISKKNSKLEKNGEIWNFKLTKKKRGKKIWEAQRRWVRAGGCHEKNWKSKKSDFRKKLEILKKFEIRNSEKIRNSKKFDFRKKLEIREKFEIWKKLEIRKNFKFEKIWN